MRFCRQSRTTWPIYNTSKMRARQTDKAGNGTFYMVWARPHPRDCRRPTSYMDTCIHAYMYACMHAFICTYAKVCACAHVRGSHLTQNHTLHIKNPMVSMFSKVLARAAMSKRRKSARGTANRLDGIFGSGFDATSSANLATDFTWKSASVMSTSCPSSWDASLRPSMNNRLPHIC